MTSLRSCRLAVPACACMLLLSGCGATPKPAEPVSPAIAPSRVEDQPIEPTDDAAMRLTLLTAELNSARSASSKVADMPKVRDPKVRQEIALHEAMYRAAYESRVARWTGHFVLEPMQEAQPPLLGVDPEEFRLRVLGSLNDLNQPMAWVTETWRRQGVDRFPGVGEPAPVATRLRIAVIERDQNSGIVVGEVADWTAGGGASRQGVIARWDGLEWQIERDPVRMTW